MFNGLWVFVFFIKLLCNVLIFKFLTLFFDCFNFCIKFRFILPTTASILVFLFFQSILTVRQNLTLFELITQLKSNLVACKVIVPEVYRDNLFCFYFFRVFIFVIPHVIIITVLNYICKVIIEFCFKLCFVVPVLYFWDICKFQSKVLNCQVLGIKS